MGLLWLWPALVLGGLLLLGYVGVRIAQDSREIQPVSAREILDERYARGDIDEEEYLRRRTALQ